MLRKREQTKINCRRTYVICYSSIQFSKLPIFQAENITKYMIIKSNTKKKIHKHCFKIIFFLFLHLLLLQISNVACNHTSKFFTWNLPNLINL